MSQLEGADDAAALAVVRSRRVALGGAGRTHGMDARTIWSVFIVFHEILIRVGAHTQSEVHFRERRLESPKRSDVD